MTNARGAIPQKLAIGLGAGSAIVLALLAAQYGFVSTPNTPLPDGGSTFPDAGYWGNVVVTGLTANSSGLDVTGWVDDGGTTPVLVEVGFDRAGLDFWKQGHLPDGGPGYVWAAVEFHVYAAVLPDGGPDISQAVNLLPPNGTYINPDGVANGSYLQEAAYTDPGHQISFFGYLGTPNSVPFQCGCAPRAGAGRGPYCVVAVEDGGWNVGVPGRTYGAGMFFTDAGCESKPCFGLSGYPTNMPSDCWYVDGGVSPSGF